MDIETSVDITDNVGADLNDANPLTCYENGSDASETAKVTIRARNNSRDPIAVAMAVDESGSMSAADVLVQETSGTFNAGTCQDETDWAAGKVNNGLQFNGIVNYVDCGRNDLFIILEQLTISAWVKIDDPEDGSWRSIMESKHSHYHDPEGYEMAYDAEDNRLLLMGSGGDYAEASVDFDTEWHHVAGTINGTTGTIYVDGVDITTDSSVSALLTTNESLRIGADNMGLDFEGMLDEVRLYNAALSAGDIATMYDLEKDGNPSNVRPDDLVGHWAFDETANAIAYDSSPNNRHCNLQHWRHYYPEGTGCAYDDNSSAGLVITNCPTSKTDCATTSCTPVIDTIPYNLDPAGPIFPLIDTNEGDYLIFAADPSAYTGACTIPSAQMRLWVERPDLVLETDDSHGYYEDVGTILPGIHNISVWSDAPVDYDIYLRQILSGRDEFDFSFGGGTADGYYAADEQECSNFENWTYLTEIDLSDYNQIYSMRHYLYYDEYQSIGGQCGTPRFMARYAEGSGNWISGQVDNGLNFRRVNYVEIPSDPGLDVQDFTYSNWFKTTTTEIDVCHPAMFTRGNDAGGNELWIGFDHVYEDTFDIYLDGSAYPINGGINLFDRQWHHLAVTYADSNLTAFVDGEHYGNSISVTRTLDFESSNAGIGTGTNFAGNFWFGQLDEVRLYNAALSAGDIASMYATEATGAISNVAPGNLVAHWDLNESSGHIVSDSSGNGHHGYEYSDDEWYTGQCGSGEFGYCHIYLEHSGIDGPYLAPGVYEFWGWSDVNTLADVTLSYGYQMWGYIYGDGTRSKTIDNGTCNGGTCQMTIDPNTAVNTNCPMHYSHSGTSAMPGAANTQVVDTYAVSEELRGLNADVTFDYTGGGDAICHGAAMGFENPFEILSDGNFDPNWFYPFANRGSSRQEDFYVNNPPSGTSSRYYRTNGPPITQGNYNILGWAELDVDYDIAWNHQRVDAARNAIKLFIDNAVWREDDEIGLVSFSSTAVLDHELTIDREAVKAEVDNLVPVGETGMADAIDTSVAELVNNSISGASRFLILLTDGRANVCSGGIACTESEALADAVSAANNARSQGVTIYVIGFADSTLIGAYEDNLREVALDREDARFSAECTNQTRPYCGRYYFAEDDAGLQDMYDLIAQEIETTLGGVEIRIPVPDGMEIRDYGSGTCGIWDDEAGSFLAGACVGACSNGDVDSCVGGETLTYYGQSLSSSLWWTANFDAVLPCNAENCGEDYALFPPVNTQIVETFDRDVTSWDGETDEMHECAPGQNEKCHKRIPFKYADLNAVFTYGLLRTGENTVSIDLEISNDGNKNVGLASSPTRPIAEGLEIVFYKTDHGNKLQLNGVGSSYWIGDEGDVNLALSSTIDDGNLYIALTDAVTPSNVCTWKEGYCIPPNVGGNIQNSYWKLRVEDIELTGCPNNNCEGTLIAEINQNRQVSECPLNNTGLLFCGEDRLRFFTIDYYVWEGTNPIGEECVLSTECDDGNPCTIDRCSGTPRVCNHETIC